MPDTRGRVTGERLRRPLELADGSIDVENRRISGYIVAKTGVFSSGRGEFDEKSLRTIVRLMNANSGGTRVNYTHGSFLADKLGQHLGRAHAVRFEGRSGGQPARVRADLHFALAASQSPDGDLAGYVLALAAEDAAALSSSLVLNADLEWQDDKMERPPIWRPTAVYASDIVAEGDAVGALLSRSGDSLTAWNIRTLGMRHIVAGHRKPVQ